MIMLIHLLIAEDEVWTRKSIREMISCNKLGIGSVEEVDNGIDALNRIQHGGIDILLTDIRMPGMNGIELTGVIRESYPEIKVVFLSGYSEFQYAQQAIKYNISEYLLKPVTSLSMNSALKKIIAEINQLKEKEIRINQMVLRQILETVPSRNIDSTDILKQNLKDAWKIIVRIQDEDNQGMEPFTHELRSLLINNKIQCIPVFVNKGWSLLLYSQQSHSMDEIISIIHAFPLWMNSNSIHIGLSSAYYDLESTWIAELESILAILSQLGNVRICKFHRYSDDGPAIGSPDLNKFLGVFETKSLIELNNFLNNYFPENATHYNIACRCYKLITALLSNSEVQEANSLNDYFYILKTLQHIIRISSDDSRNLVQYLKDVCRRDFESMIENQKTKNENIIDWCQNYIMNNLNGDISLSILAQKLHFSPSHLSNLFKQATNKNYIDFITELKIKKAKNYLRNTNMNINDISICLGYTDVRYFSKLFKKIEGIPPSLYKEKVKDRIQYV